MGSGSKRWKKVKVTVFQKETVKHHCSETALDITTAPAIFNQVLRI
jgi:hypothetical protein